MVAVKASTSRLETFISIFWKESHQIFINIIAQKCWESVWFSFFSKDAWIFLFHAFRYLTAINDVEFRRELVFVLCTCGNFFFIIIFSDGAFPSLWPKRTFLRHFLRRHNRGHISRFVQETPLIFCLYYVIAISVEKNRRASLSFFYGRDYPWFSFLFISLFLFPNSLWIRILFDFHDFLTEMKTYFHM